MSNSRFKFRAWHIENNEMIYFDNLKASKDQYISSAMVFLMSGEDDSGHMMQWTGLTDKNGVDIYESDVCKSVSELIRPFAGRHKENTGRYSTKYHVIEYRNESASFCIVGSALSSISQSTATEYYEVIGNIHQNPELLTNEH